MRRTSLLLSLLLSFQVCHAQLRIPVNPAWKTIDTEYANEVFKRFDYRDRTSRMQIFDIKARMIGQIVKVCKVSDDQWSRYVESLMQTSAHDEGIRNLIEDSGLSAATQEFAGSAYLDKLSQDKKTELLSFQNSDLGKTVIVGWLNAGVNVVFGQAHDQVALAYLSTHCDGAH